MKTESQNQELYHIWIELTNRCNLTCSHCYANSSPTSVDSNPLSIEQYEMILLDGFQLGARSVQFIGGEPTINPYLGTLLKKSRAIGFDRIEIFSNLNKISDELWSVIKSTGTSLATSVYSHRDAIHDQITGSPGSHRKTISNVQQALELHIPIRIGVIEMDVNSNDVADTVKYLGGMGVQDVGTDRIRGIGRGGETDSCGVGELCGHCWRGNLCVDPSGEVSPCIMSKNWKIGNIHDKSLSKLAISGRIGTTRKQLSEEWTAANPTPSNGCAPDDKCNPGACKPQVGGPPGCYPKKACAPKIFDQAPQKLALTES